MRVFILLFLSLSLSACSIQAPYPSPTDSQSSRDNHNVSQQELLAAGPIRRATGWSRHLSGWLPD